MVAITVAPRSLAIWIAARPTLLLAAVTIDGVVGAESAIVHQRPVSREVGHPERRALGRRKRCGVRLGDLRRHGGALAVDALPGLGERE